jgi:hypothetical protein
MVKFVIFLSITIAWTLPFCTSCFAFFGSVLKRKLVALIGSSNNNNSIQILLHHCHHYRQRNHQCILLKPLYSSKNNNDIDNSINRNEIENQADEEVDDVDDTNVDWESLSAELLLENEDDGLNDGEWLSDREKARLKLEQQQQQQRIYHTSVSSAIEEERDDTATVVRVESESDESEFVESTDSKSSTTNDPIMSNRPGPYTDEEEEIITAMGGKNNQQRRRREPGFLGDSTLVEICSDYSVPISYLADVLCMWGVPIPINIYDRLGDLVTGEQAFAIVEAVNTLDVAALHDRYSNTNLQQLCYEWDIDLQDAFEMAMKEGWSLPFGVETCLRVEQERELLRVLGSQSGLSVNAPDDEYDDDY